MSSLVKNFSLNQGYWRVAARSLPCTRPGANPQRKAPGRAGRACLPAPRRACPARALMHASMTHAHAQVSRWTCANTSLACALASSVHAYVCRQRAKALTRTLLRSRSRSRNRKTQRLLRLGGLHQQGPAPHRGLPRRGRRPVREHHRPCAPQVGRPRHRQHDRTRRRGRTRRQPPG